MKYLGLIAVLSIALSAGAAKPDPTDYQDGVLRAFHSITVGSRCTSSGDVSATSYGNSTQGDTSSVGRCRNLQRAIYTVQVGDSTYQLSPQPSFFSVKPSSLSNHLPGTPIKVRADGSAFFVKVGDRETRYTLYEAH